MAWKRSPTKTQHHKPIHHKTLKQHAHHARKHGLHHPHKGWHGKRLHKTA